MGPTDEHYERLTRRQRATRFASCGYSDRFDPFVLNKDPFLRDLYGSLFNSFLADIPHARVLDVGCGTGVYFDALAEHCDTIDAMDLSPAMAAVADDYCRQSGLTGIRVSVGSAESLPYDSATFDTVVAMDLLHHVMDLDRTLAEIHRVLEPGGHLLVFEPNICNPVMWLAHAVPSEERRALRRNRPGTLRRSLESRFEPVRWDGVCALITRTKGLKRIVLETYLGVWRILGVKQLYPRQAVLVRKR